MVNDGVLATDTSQQSDVDIAQHFPSLGIGRSATELNELVSAAVSYAPRSERRESSHNVMREIEFRELFAALSSPHAIVAWIVERRELLQSLPLHDRYSKVFHKELAANCKRGVGRPRFAHELEVLFLYEHGFSAEVIAKALHLLCKVQQDFEAYLRQVKRAISNQKKRDPALYAASALVAEHWGSDRAAREFARAQLSEPSDRPKR